MLTKDSLKAKFSHDWDEVTVVYPEQWEAMETQRVRDAQDEMTKWHREQEATLTDEGLAGLISYYEEQLTEDALKRCVDDHIEHCKQQLGYYASLRNKR